MIAEHEVLVPFRSENTERVEVHDRHKRVHSFSDTKVLLDLGKENFGGSKVHLYCAFELRDSVMMGETSNEDGHVRHEMACGPDYIENWTLVKGQNTYSTLTMKNFRVVELLGFEGDLPLDAINGWALTTAFPDNESQFDSDSELLNREYELSKYTIQATKLDVFVDTTARERRPYEGDLLVHAHTSYSVTD